MSPSDQRPAPKGPTPPRPACWGCQLVAVDWPADRPAAGFFRDEEHIDPRIVC